MTAKRAGFITLIGEPNAGKSTLLNAAIGAKLAIVTHKVQTTRARLRGITTRGESQLIFVDTPGLFQPRRRLDRAMVSAAWGGTEDADLVALLVEAHRGVTSGVERIIAQLKESGHSRILLVINKIDKVKSEKLLGLSKDLNERLDFARTYMISAEEGYGVEGFLNEVAQMLPEGPWLYPEDQMADVPLRMVAAEITREKLMLRLHDEIPYQLTVENEKWEERKDGSVRIDQLIFVARDGHKGIILGKRGETIKAVGKAAREDISNMLDQKVHLFLQIKVDPKWLDSKERFEEMGLDFVKDLK